MDREQTLKQLTKGELVRLLEDAAKNWLAHDGLWFQAVEGKYGLETAIALDAEAWRSFTVIEAKRIMKRWGIEERGGLPALKKALGFRLYAYINAQEIIDLDENRFIFRMNTCRVQDARKRRGLDDFPCKEVGIVEYSEFARAIDPRIETRCVTCPPDPHPEEYWCAWEFSMNSHRSAR